MRGIKTLLIAVALLVSAAACGHKQNANVQTQSAGGAAANAGGSVVASAGTDFSGKLSTPIGTKTSKNGDAFSLSETSSSSSALAGSTIDGHLTGIEPAGPMHDAKMTIVFDDIRLADGTKAPVDVQLITTKAFDPKTHHWRTFGMVIAGAVAGHEMKVHAGHGNSLLGAAGGYVLSQQLKTDVAVPAGTVIEVKFRQPVTTGAASGT
jgi:hypothetical protein